MRSLILAVSGVMLFAVGCGQKKTSNTTPSDSMAQQIGDAMTAIDDSGGSDGGYSFMKREQRVFARLAPEQTPARSFMMRILPEASAASCALTDTWGSCASNLIVRDFQNCTWRGATFSGTVTFTFVDAAVNDVCSMAAAGHSVARDPDFTITGARGGTYTVAKTGTEGQKVERTGVGTYVFSNDGIRRTLAFNGSTLADYTSTTAAGINITGSVRNGRIADGGTLRILNNRTSVSCDFSPSDVTWNSTCNCAVSGTWAATCSDGASASYSISGCGTGTLTVNGSAESVTLDQCE